MLAQFEHYQRPDLFGNLVGYEILTAPDGSGKCVARLVVKPELLSPSGRIHGGAVATLLDMALGAAAFTRVGKSDRIATLDLNVHYLQAMQEGDVIIALAEVLQESGRFLRAECKLFHERDTEIESGATASLRRAKSGAAALALGIGAFYLKRV